MSDIAAEYHLDARKLDDRQRDLLAELHPVVSARFPATTGGGMVRYLVAGIPTGDFLRAILCNDLFEATRRADELNLPLLGAWVKFLYHHAPGESWRSADRVQAWIARGGAREDGGDA